MVEVNIKVKGEASEIIDSIRAIFNSFGEDSMTEIKAEQEYKSRRSRKLKTEDLSDQE
ncbi:TPA: hypothetical protein KRM34_002089 [Clostridioides difficile]|uniref:hypothetical protein n=1 Tax=Clostridioides difficile TaxID=1496 RepID=UPI00131D0A1C|nr:hypothetical protein [Clostridioides difficile]EGT2203777.1 hypothetical protein [Clostridioides difficile]HBE9443327.1 hypothetical protein [Clostridioides difficile]HBF4873007.1 hypothetical protein [Clostridioides difficile]HBG4838842.1 hypothetical protein [Clostridioides difficile]HBH1636497.1 hypothetical protein [Clostridioides difficile]